MSLGSKLKELRVRKGESLQDVANAVKASKAHIWELETGRSANPSLDLLERLARHYKVSVAALAGEPGDPKVMLFGREVGEKLTEEDLEFLRRMADRMVQNKG